MFIIDISGKVNPDLVKERRKCTFDIEEMAKWWWNGTEELNEKRKIDKFFFDDPELHDKIPTAYLSAKELHTEYFRKLGFVTKKVKEYVRLNGGDKKSIIERVNQEIDIVNRFPVSGIYRDNSPVSVHYGMFLNALINLTNEEQQSDWLEPALNLKMIGTYAQTEIGHGTFVRGLETTATYDSIKQEFIMNTPSLSAYKWWPGGLGNNTNFAIVVAQLYTNGKCHGVHQFLVQIRNSDTWEPMPGVSVGECGPKLGTKAYNNGYLKLDNVRIPRKNMLMRFAQVLENGTLIQAPSRVLAYNTMMHIRAMILLDGVNCISKASVIATRYSAVRRQSPIEPNKAEPQIIDHVTQQYKLFPNIARSIVFKILFNNVWKLFEIVCAEVNEHNLTNLPELHAILSCFKPYVTAEVATGVEQLRLSCGGHGYMDSANFTYIYANSTAACTYEGENTVLYLQAARYLMKSWNNLQNGQELGSSVNYLKNFKNINLNWLDLSYERILNAFEIVAAQKVKLAYEHIEQRKKSGFTHEQANNMTGIELVQAAEAHSKVFLIRTVKESLNQLKQSMSLQLFTVIQQLVELYVIDTTLKSLQDLLRFTNLSEFNIQNLQKRLENLLAEIRPNAIGICDGFDYHDVMLCSTLGSYDGMVYERLYNDAQKSPLNQYGVQDAWQKYLKPLMKTKL